MVGLALCPEQRIKKKKIFVVVIDQAIVTDSFLVLRLLKFGG